MKKKIAAMTLAIMAGVSVLGMTAEAMAAGCTHPRLEAYSYTEYESANSEYHWAMSVIEYSCRDCGYYDWSMGERAYEAHDFSDYASDGRYCTGCGEKDEFFQ